MSNLQMISSVIEWYCAEQEPVGTENADLYQELEPTNRKVMHLNSCYDGFDSVARVGLCNKGTSFDAFFLDILEIL